MANLSFCAKPFLILVLTFSAVSAAEVINLPTGIKPLNVKTALAPNGVRFVFAQTSDNGVFVAQSAGNWQGIKLPLVLPAGYGIDSEVNPIFAPETPVPGQPARFTLLFFARIKNKATNDARVYRGYYNQMFTAATPQTVPVASNWMGDVLPTPGMPAGERIDGNVLPLSFPEKATGTNTLLYFARTTSGQAYRGYFDNLVTNKWQGGIIPTPGLPSALNSDLSPIISPAPESMPLYFATTLDGQVYRGYFSEGSWSGGILPIGSSPVMGNATPYVDLNAAEESRFFGQLGYYVQAADHSVRNGEYINGAWTYRAADVDHAHYYGSYYSLFRATLGNPIPLVDNGVVHFHTYLARVAGDNYPFVNYQQVYIASYYVGSNRYGNYHPCLDDMGDPAPFMDYSDQLAKTFTISNGAIYLCNAAGSDATGF